MTAFEIIYQIIDSLLLSLTLIGNVNCGVTQKSALSPQLVLIYVNDIANASPNSDIRLFADDINVFVCGKYLI